MAATPVTCKPAVDRRVLVLTSGTLYLGVAALLVSLAGGWMHAERDLPIWPPFVGVPLGAIVYAFGLKGLVDRNLARIRSLPERACAFAFMPTKNYLIVAIMIGGGILLRHSTIPKLFLVAPYLGMGEALALSSVRYLRGLVGVAPGA